MGADILERLDFMMISRRSDEDAIIRDARAEIVRLRGEVEALATELGERVALTYPDAPAMPNGVEDMHDDLSTPDLLNEAERIAVNQHKDGRYAAARILRILCHRLRAADNRDAAGVVPAWIATWMADREILPDDDGDGISEGALVEALNNHERELLNAIPKAPAAVPTGEANADAPAGVLEHLIFSVDRVANSGDYGLCDQAVVQLNYAIEDARRGIGTGAPQPANGEAVAEWQVWHKEDGWGATHPDNVAEYRARGVPVRPLYAHPPAPVQAAPQEGEDAAEAYRKAWEAGHAAACELVVDDAMVERVCRNHFPDWDMYGPAGKMVRSADIRRLLTAALQHRGDSQEVGRG